MDKTSVGLSFLTNDTGRAAVVAQLTEYAEESGDRGLYGIGWTLDDQ